MTIIDIHTHLGDILYPRQNSLIWERGIKKKPDWNDVYEKYNWPEWHRFHSVFGQITHRLNIRAGQNRNRTATLENMQKAMEKNGVDRCAVLSVYPYVPAEQIIEASQKDGRIIPFTGPDYTDGATDHTVRFRHEVTAGVSGLKLHPILDQIPLDSDKTFEIVEAFAPHNRPVLFHSGYAFYFASKEEQIHEQPEFGEIPPANALVEAFPNVNFIVGHAGLGQVQEVIDRLAKYSNVFVDTSFQPPHMIRALIDALGPERVLYGSDWPWGGMEVAKRCVEIACKGDKGLEAQIFYNNSVALIDG